MAGLLVAAAALRAGAGVVTVLVPDAIQPTVAGALREAMVRPLSSQRPIPGPSTTQRARSA